MKVSDIEIDSVSTVAVGFDDLSFCAVLCDVEVISDADKVCDIGVVSNFDEDCNDWVGSVVNLVSEEEGGGGGGDDGGVGGVDISLASSGELS